ncbi:MAG: nicotinate-nucleotide adenylyltransferase [Thermomicrobiales bacterium]
MSRCQPTRRIGVFGGTFDPVHNGHLAIAEAIRNHLDLDTVLWVPAGRPPHKEGQIISDDEDRLAMLELALAETGGNVISRADLDRGGPSYTADLLEILNRENAPSSLIFIMGEDSLRDLPNWHDPERILRQAELAVAARPNVDTDLDALEQRLPALRGRVHLIEAPEVPISSSDIRSRVQERQSISSLVPPSVAKYIADHGLYRDAPAR